jgi:2-keto-4-pentenoate hydratase
LCYLERMSPEDMQAACALLYRHWADGTQLEALPPGLVPADRAEAYRVQALLEGYSRAPLYGWKIAATSVAGQRHIGVDGPLAGRILAERVIADGGACPLGNNLMKVAELEFAFRMASDLPPRREPYMQEEVLAAVESLHPAIELPDSRFRHFERAGLAQLVADNACAHRFVLGPAARTDWRVLDLAGHKGRMFRNSAVAEDGIGSNVLGDPRIALTWLVNELSRHGETLKARQVITTGTCVKPVPIAQGDRFDGDLGVLGQVSVSIV